MLQKVPQGKKYGYYLRLEYIVLQAHSIFKP